MNPPPQEPNHWIQSSWAYWTSLSAQWLSVTYVIGSLLLSLDSQLSRYSFIFIRGVHLRPIFADLDWITSTSGCGVDLQQLARLEVPHCDAWERAGLGYPPMSIEFARFLDVKESHTNLLGIAFGLSVIVIIAGLCHRLLPTRTVRQFGTAFLLLSFPMQFALERANLDIVLFLLITSLSALIALQNWALFPLISFIAWLMVSVKVYPIVGMVGWIGLSLPKFDRAKLFVLAGCVAGLATSFSWLIEYGNTAAQPGAGIKSHALIMGPYGTVIASVFLSISFIIFYRLNTFQHLEETIDTCFAGWQARFASNLIGISSLTWLGCYVLSSSFDYRLVFAYPGIIAQCAILMSRRSKAESRLMLTFISLLIIAFISSRLNWLPGRLIYLHLAYDLIRPATHLIILPVVAGALISQQIRWKRVAEFT